MTKIVLVVQCRDRPGIVHATTGAILALDGNILESHQHRDELSDDFVLRVTFETSATKVQAEEKLRAELAEFEPVFRLRTQDEPYRVLLIVSKIDHCLIDLLYRHQIGELAVEIPLIISNHRDLEPVAQSYKIPFAYIPVTLESKAHAEAQTLKLIEENSIDLVVLARYMQILSDEMCDALPGRIINIHHSFLPGFKGAKPYQQAYQRGVKLIGASAHYATGDLDEGPIIEQDVARVTHVHDAAELQALGRDIERRVLAKAVRLHIEDRLVVVNDRTIVFE